MEFHGLTWISEIGISDGVLPGWGTQAADWGWVQFGVRISLITSFRDTCFIEIVPAEQKSKRGLYFIPFSPIYYRSICT